LGCRFGVGHIVVVTCMMHQNEPVADPADDLEGLRVGLRALSRMAEAAPLDLARLAGACAVDIALVGRVVAVFEEMGYVCRLSFDTLYTLTDAGRALANCVQRQGGTRMIH